MRFLKIVLFLIFATSTLCSLSDFETCNLKKFYDGLNAQRAHKSHCEKCFKTGTMGLYCHDTYWINIKETLENIDFIRKIEKDETDETKLSIFKLRSEYNNTMDIELAKSLYGLEKFKSDRAFDEYIKSNKTRVF